LGYIAENSPETPLGYAVASASARNIVSPASVTQW
jgi:hypothetical protein